MRRLVIYHTYHMKLFKWFKRSQCCLPRFAEGICWATGLSLTTPFTEGCAGANNKASPPWPSSGTDA